MIINGVGIEEVEVYQFLSNRFAKRDPSQDPLFQFVFRSFYRIDNAGLTPDFKDRYFILMSQARQSKSVNLNAILEDLWRFPNRMGQSKLQFSFATKLAATVDASYPIYDSEVARVFNFTQPYNYKPFNKRLAEYLEFYYSLWHFYSKVVGSDQVQLLIDQFHSKYHTSKSEIGEIRAFKFSSLVVS